MNLLYHLTKFANKLVLPKIIEDREALAGNPNTSPDVLMLLAKDKEFGVRSNVVYNPNTPPEALALLAKDKHWTIRQEIISNPNTPLNSLIGLINDKNKQVRNSLAMKLLHNGNIPMHVYVQLKHDKYTEEQIY